MKRFSKFICIILILSICCTLVLTGCGKTKDGLEKVKSDEFEYSILLDGSIEVTGYKGNAVSFEIPDSMGGLTVTSVGEYAFYENEAITKVVIPQTVTNIGEGAFSCCSNLSEITIPESVVTIGEYAFDSCTSLTSVTIPEGVKTIGEEAFFECTGLKKVTFPSTVTEIPAWIFSGCTSLVTINLPDTITKIGECAFYDTGYAADEENWEDDVLYIGNHLISADISGDYVVKEGTVCIADSAFSYCDYLFTVELPDSVVSIGDDAFMECYNLNDIKLSNSLQTIGEGAFTKCYCLENVVLPVSVVNIGVDAFAKCESLKSVSIPNADCEIGNSQKTFYKDAKIKGVDESTAQEYAKKYDREFIIIEG